MIIEFPTLITDALPVASEPLAVCSEIPDLSVKLLTSVDFLYVKYDSAFLLPVRLETALTHSEMYASACESGFDSYFDGLELADRDASCAGAYDKRARTREEVMALVAENVVPDFYLGERTTCLCWRVGFVLGWLSFLAFTQLDLALAGLELLHILAARLQKGEAC